MSKKSNNQFIELDDAALNAVVGGSGTVQTGASAAPADDDEREYNLSISGPVVTSGTAGVVKMESVSTQVGDTTLTGAVGVFAGAKYEVTQTGVGATAGAGAFATASASHTDGNVTTTVTAQTAAGAMVNAEAGLTGVSLSGAAGIGGTISVTVQTDHELGGGVTASTTTTVEAGLRAGAEGEMSYGLNGVKSEAEVYAGAYHSVTGSATIGGKGGSGTVTGGYVDPGSAGVGMSGELGMDNGKVTVGLGGEAAIGIGGVNLGASVTVDTQVVAAGAEKAAAETAAGTQKVAAETAAGAEKAVADTKELLSNPKSGLRGAMTGMFGGAKGGGVFGGGIFGGGSLGEIASGTVGMGKAVADVGKGTVNTVADGTKSTVNTVADGTKSAVNTVADGTKSVGNTLSSGGNSAVKSVRKVFGI